MTCPQCYSVRFSNASDPDGELGYPVFHNFGKDQLISYIWDFGDGSNGIKKFSRDPNHAFSSAGTYHVTVTVFDRHGAIGQDSMTVTVLP